MAESANQVQDFEEAEFNESDLSCESIQEEGESSIGLEVQKVSALSLHIHSST